MHNADRKRQPLRGLDLRTEEPTAPSVLDDSNGIFLAYICRTHARKLTVEIPASFDCAWYPEFARDAFRAK